MGDSSIGLQARLMSKAMRKLSGVINQKGCTAIFINQLREKVGVMFGNPETTTGGRALKFYASIRMDVRRSETIKSGTDVIGNRVTIKVVKNKVAPPFKSATVEIRYGEGISRVSEVLDLAVENNLVQKSGSWFTYKEEKIAQGRESARNYLLAHPEVTEELTAALREILFPKEAAE